MDDVGTVAMVTKNSPPRPPPPPCPPPPLPGRTSLPPPPPPPSRDGTLIQTAPSLPLRFGDQHRLRLRNFNWDALPAERVLAGHNLWTCGPQEPNIQLDLSHMEELFAQREEARKTRVSRSFRARATRGPTEPEVTLLDAKKSMNLGIYLKQFKRPVHVMIEDIKRGVGSNFGADKLGELQKLLPEKAEVKKLKAFKGERSRLSDPELFMVLLVEVPSFSQRLQVMILKEEFFPQLNSLKQAVQVQMAAATELLQCEELHTIIHLVLKAGNYMNAGGYAGSALGFRMGSLLKIADTKANKPGMNLMHFVAQEAEKNDHALLIFPDKLVHISPASRITSQEIESDLENLSQKLSSTREALRDQPDLRHEMGIFLQVAEQELCAVLCSLQALRDARRSVMDFFCEDESVFRLEEMCLVFSTFCAKFVSAVQENKEREKAEHRKERLEKRRSIASCSTHDKDLQDVELEFLRLRLPRRGRPNRAPRPLPRTHSCDVNQTSPTANVPPGVSSSSTVTTEPIREEEDTTPVSVEEESPQSHGLRRPRTSSIGKDGQLGTPGKMNRRHTLTCIPYQGEGRPQLHFTPFEHGQQPSSNNGGSDKGPQSTPSTPTTAPLLFHPLRSWAPEASSNEPSSPTSGSPPPLRLGGLFQRRGSLQSPDPPRGPVAEDSPQGSSETKALTNFFRRFESARRSPK
ncbi:FH2 domain-containing protein 1-like [Discoglossus pictus]